MNRRLILAGLVAVIASVSVPALARIAASDVSGAWSGTIAIPEKGQRQKNPLFASLKQNGSELSGTIGPEQDAQLAITKGYVETTKYGTVVTFDLPAASFVMHFELH